jgi:hypothetical protein
MAMRERVPYQTPEVTEYGSVESMTTQQDDKIGSVADDITTSVDPTLDGDRVPDS